MGQYSLVINIQFLSIFIRYKNFQYVSTKFPLIPKRTCLRPYNMSKTYKSFGVINIINGLILNSNGNTVNIHYV